nr:MAG TPA: putative tail fiber protein [Caudoviricetes sp.]
MILRNGLIKQWGIANTMTVTYPLPFSRLDNLMVFANYAPAGIGTPNTSYVLGVTALDRYGVNGFTKSSVSYASVVFISWKATGI